MMQTIFGLVFHPTYANEGSQIQSHRLESNEQQFGKLIMLLSKSGVIMPNTGVFAVEFYSSSGLGVPPTIINYLHTPLRDLRVLGSLFVQISTVMD